MSTEGVRLGNDSGQVIAEKIFGFFATKMPKLPHSEPLAAELSGAVDRGAHAVDRRIGKTLSAYFLTEQAAFFILIALVKNVTVHLRHSQYNRMHAPRTFYCHEPRLAAERRML